jgi:hypothetical protein
VTRVVPVPADANDPSYSEMQEVSVMRNDMICLKLLRWWILMNVDTSLQVAIPPASDEGVGEDVGDPGGGGRYAVTSNLTHERSTVCVYSFSAKESFLVMFILRRCVLYTMDLILSSINPQSFIASIATHPYHQQRQYCDVFENIHGITVACFELLEDSILMRNELGVAVCAEICSLSLQSVAHMTHTWINIEGDIDRSDLASTSSVLMSVVEWRSLLSNNHYLISVSEQLLVGFLSAAKEKKNTRSEDEEKCVVHELPNVDSTLIIELLHIIKNFQSVPTAVAVPE